MQNSYFLNKYKSDGFDKVQGWCKNKNFDIIEILDGAPLNKVGGCLEIGVHHGKFYILMNSVIDADFKSYAVDLFENQELNIDKSGKGNLQYFKENLNKYDRHKGANTEIIIGDSTDAATIKKLKNAVGDLRFISVDGGHTAQHTASDLALACSLISNEGVVVLDDILNHHWLGVLEGAVTYLNSKPTLTPFAIGQNKLLFSKISYRDCYFDIFKNSNLCTKHAIFFGYPVIAL